jgi:hypothetical protein
MGVASVFQGMSLGIMSNKSFHTIPPTSLFGLVNALFVHVSLQEHIDIENSMERLMRRSSTHCSLREPNDTGNEFPALINISSCRMLCVTAEMYDVLHHKNFRVIYCSLRLYVTLLTPEHIAGWCGGGGG